MTEMHTAYLEVSVRTNPLGKREAINYAWKGKSPYVRVSREYASGQGVGPYEMKIGPYHLLVCEYEPARDTFLCVRKDKLGALRVALYKSTRLLDLIYRRLIITLAVWQLAEFTPARIPSWKDIKALKRFAK